MAYAIGLVLSYLVQLWEGRAFCAWQARKSGAIKFGGMIFRLRFQEDDKVDV